MEMPRPRQRCLTPEATNTVRAMPWATERAATGCRPGCGAGIGARLHPTFAVFMKHLSNQIVLVAAAWLAGAAIGDHAAAQALPAQSSPAPLEPGAAARFDRTTVGFREFDIYLGRRFLKDSLGKQALDYIVRDLVLGFEIEKRNIQIAASDFDEALRAMDAQLKQATGRSLDGELAAKGMDRATFEAIYRKQVACERLVRADLGLQQTDPITSEQQELWIADRVKRASIITDAARLGEGIVATVNGKIVSLENLGNTIRLKLSKSDARDAIRAFLGIVIIHARAVAAGVKCEAADLEAAIDRRRERFARNPMMTGVTFEQFLEARGNSLDDVRADPALRAEAELWKLASIQFPDEEVDVRYRSRREYYDGLFGEQRRVSWIFLYADESPNALIPDSYESADAKLKDMIARAESPADFGRLASIYSKHDDSRKRQGELGWLHRREQNVDREVLEAAFKADPAKPGVIGPVRTPKGSALLYLHGARPAPAMDIMRRAVRGDLTADLFRKFAEEANIVTYLDAPRASGAASQPK